LANQQELWLSILVRKLTNRGSFISVEDLKMKILGLIDYYNRTMVKPPGHSYEVVQPVVLVLVCAAKCTSGARRVYI